MSKIRAGVDIGADGAYAIFVDDKLKHYGKMPTVSDELDMFTLMEYILDEMEPGDNSIHVVIEDLNSIFGSSAKSNFIFGVNNGLVIGMLQSARLPFTKVHAKRWQKELFEGIRPVEVLVKGKTNKDGSPKYKVDTKATALIAAKRLWPDKTFLATERSKVPHNGIVDACCIAYYCNKHF